MAVDVECGGGDGGDIWGAGILSTSGSGACISSLWESSAT